MSVSIVVVSAVSSVHAEPAYPFVDVDRPILAPAGMTELDLGLGFPTLIETSVDDAGNGTSEKKVIRRALLDVGVYHSFGGWNVGLRHYETPSPFATLSVAHDLGPGSLVASVTAFTRFLTVNTSLQYYVNEALSYRYKWIVVPSRLSLSASGGLNVTELESKDDTATRSGQRLRIFGGATGTVQLASRVALAIGGSIGGPIVESSAVASTTEGGIGAEVIVTFAHWDFYAKYGLAIDSDHVLQDRFVGFVHRWW